jgi:CelD/BcsL family acetyltransferase involved in cellulose biosynthesis
MTAVSTPSAPSLRSSALRCDLVDLAWLKGRAAAWDRLVEDAATPNPFYARRVVAAHEDHGLADTGLRFVVVHRDGALLALQPCTPRGAWLGARRIAAGWISPFVVTSTPLVARDAVAEHMAALLDGLRSAGSMVLLPLLSLESDAGAALRAGLAERGWPCHIFDPFARPVLDRSDAGAYEAHLGAKRRKDLRRRRARLAEQGRVEMRSFVAGEGLRRAIEDFLILEQRGWKGARRTALASRAETAAFLRALFADGQGPVACRADVLSLDERPIAISLAFVCGGTAYLFKIAYDESLRRYAPGVLLEDEIVRLCRETGFAERLNSASTPGSLLAALYPHREPIGDLLLATASGMSAERLAVLAKQEMLRRHTLGGLKRLYRRLRAACQPTSAPGLASVEGK